MLKKIKNNDIHLNEQVLQIKKKNIFQVTTNKKTYFFATITNSLLPLGPNIGLSITPNNFIFISSSSQ